MGLTIIGTVHLDPDGYERLIEALDQLMPRIVTVDVSQYAVEFRRKRCGGLRSRLAPFRKSDGSLPAALEAVEAQMDVPFEVRAAEDWCKANKRKYYLLGDDADSAIRLDLFEHELMTPENLARLASEDVPSLAAQVRLQWRKAGIRNGAQAPVQPCDERTAGLLMGLLSSQDVSVCHVTGWEHLPPLDALLAGFSPAIRLLSECLLPDSPQ